MIVLEIKRTFGPELVNKTILTLQPQRSFRPFSNQSDSNLCSREFLRFKKFLIIQLKFPLTPCNAIL